MPQELSRPLPRGRRARGFFARLATAVLALAMLTSAAPMAHAAPKNSGVDEDDIDKQEGRLDGYPVVVRLEKGGTGMTWFLFSFTALISVAVLFKNANRSHLD